MPREWEKHAACAGSDPSIFFPPAEEAEWFVYSAAAKEICCDCSVLWDCLACGVLNREDHGVWGGTVPHVRDGIYAAWKRDGQLGFMAAMGEAIEHLGRTVAGLPDERPITPEHPCVRCGERVAAAVLPNDRNGPDANCAIVATYNKGCRCDPCKEAKSRLFKDRNAGGSSSP